MAFALGGLVFLAIAAAGFAWSSGDADPDPVWHGTQLAEPARERPSFVLTGTDGEPYDFRAETAGRLTLVFFGYTSCPDVCPVHMATIAEALDKTDAPATVVFVTTDPARDTPERIRSWLDSFDPDFVGLTGDLAQIEAAQVAMGTTVAIAEEADDDGDYLVGHTSGVFVITPDDRVRLVYPFGTRQQDWVDDLTRIVDTEEWQAAGERAP